MLGDFVTGGGRAAGTHFFSARRIEIQVHGDPHGAGVTEEPQGKQKAKPDTEPQQGRWPDCFAEEEAQVGRGHDERGQAIIDIDRAKPVARPALEMKSTVAAPRVHREPSAK